MKILGSLKIVTATLFFAELIGCSQKLPNSLMAQPSSQSQASTGSSSGGTPPTFPPAVSPTGGCASSSGVANNFPCTMYFNQNISKTAIAGSDLTYSNDIINNLNSRGGWGNSNIFQIDFSIDVLHASAGSGQFKLNAGSANNSYNNWTYPDSDLPSQIPAPPANSSFGFESSSGAVCDGGDCHYLVVDSANSQLTEVYGANVVGGMMSNSGYGSIAIWPFGKNWLANYRGDSCTSADAGGLMIAPLLFSGSEIATGAINHGIRFILPNARIANLTYVRPATHTTGGSTWAPAPVKGASDPYAMIGVPYGTRLRLKSTYTPPNGTSKGALVVIAALKNYGMFLADGGNIALTAEKSAANYIAARDLSNIKVTDFEVIPSPPFGILPGGATLNGNVISVNGLNCNRNP